MIADLNIKLAAACAGTYALGAVPQWQSRDQRVHVYLSQIDGIHVIAHEGTTSWDNRTSLPEWLIDFDATPVLSPNSAYGHVHQGMMEDVLSIVDQIDAYLAGLGYPPYLLTGHSKGAGEVTLEHAEMKRRGHPPLATRAFEPPQVGGHALRDYLSDQDYAWTCTVNAQGKDLVTRVPEGLQLPFLTDWSHIQDPIMLVVPDTYDVATKHRIPAVQEALAALPVAVAA
jgi:lipase (class 3)